MTELPSYCLELAPATGSDSIANWARSAGVPASVLIDRFKPATCEATHPDGSGTVVLGHPIRGERIDVRRICSEVPHYINDDNWIAAINGEFLILHASKRSLFVITSRFGYPSLWYGENGNRTVLGTLFADVRDRVLEIGEERLNLQAIFETLTYKRVFGSKTIHSNIQAVPPATVMEFSLDGVRSRKYWCPTFGSKLRMTAADSADELSLRITSALRRKTSDGARCALFLSGGMDTRLILAHAAADGLDLPCITINAFENREVRVARQVAEICGQRHIFLPTPDGHYRKTLGEAVRLAGGMSTPMCMFHGHGDRVREIADVGLHGHGFDYFFQGMYVPSKRYRVFGRVIPYKRLRPIVSDVVEDFMASISYRVTGESLLRIGRPDVCRARAETLREELRQLAATAESFGANAFDTYEWLAFHNLARHYSIGDHWGINTLVEQRTISFDNDLYDLFAQIPISVRFDARALRRCLRRCNPQLANLVSANHGYPITLSSAGRTLRTTVDFLVRRMRAGRPKFDDFDRMGLPQWHLISGEWRDAILDLSRSSRLDSIDFLDADAARSFAREAADGLRVENAQFLTLLMTIDMFLAHGTRS